MSLPAFQWQQLDLSGTKKQSLPPIKIPPNQSVRAHVMLTYMTESAAGAGANCYISEFVQNGQSTNGAFRLIAGQNITEITFTLEVWNSSASATLLVERF